MTGLLRTRKAFIVAVTLAGMAALVATVMTYPAEVASPTLGARWQCRASAFMTSCTQRDVRRIAPALHRIRQNANELRRV